jgi:hypothetical protein
VFTAETMTRSGAAKRKGLSSAAAPRAARRGSDSGVAATADAEALELDELGDVDGLDGLDGLDDLDGFDDFGFEGGVSDGEPEFQVDADIDHHGEPGHGQLPFVDDDHYPELPVAEQEALRRQLQDRLAAYLSAGRARVVITDNLRTMMSIKRGHGVYTFRLHHMFVDASPTILRAVTAYAEGQDNAAAKLLREFIDQNEDAIRQRMAPRPYTIDVEGRHHDLQAIFDELNREYFGGSIEARITWGPRTQRKAGRASIKLGSYTVEDQLIRIHPVLDAADVPRYYLAWVVYHEMLHEIHDMPVIEGRRVYHTRAFRQAEARFEQYPEAVLWERTNLAKLLDR